MCAANDRQIRVFISSTFSDMKQEREILVKKVFPKLRKLCESKGIIWGEVDLRWGITDEQQAEGKVLPICLEEINNCKPYFIGMLGERYGWIPFEIPDELVKKEPWLAEHREKSVTELEILHGVINNTNMNKRAFFYLRDPDWLSEIPESEKKIYVENPTKEEIRYLGKEKAEERAEQRRCKLKALKDKIRNTDHVVRENYINPEKLGELVLEDITNMIKEQYPDDDRANPLDIQAAQHHAFSLSRSSVYVKRQDYFDFLEKFTESENKGLLISGESGCGKTSLAVNWLTEYAKNNPEVYSFVHYIGSTPVSTDANNILYRLSWDIIKKFNLQVQMPQNPEQYSHFLQDLILEIDGREKYIIVIDSLDQLDKANAAERLLWLPEEIPSNVKIIVTSLKGTAYDAVISRKYELLTMDSLNDNEKKLLIDKYLAWCHKSMNKGTIFWIAGSKKTENPLYLRLLLEELRIEGKFDTLEEQIEYYLKAETIPELLTLVLNRLENDFGSELVEKALCYLWASREGLTESELLDLLGEKDSPMAMAVWSPLYISIRHLISLSAGKLLITHDYLRKAIESKYLSLREKEYDIRIRVAEYFSRTTVPRWMIETPWQYFKLGEWKMLSELLVQPNFLVKAYSRIEFEYYRYWVQIEENSSITLKGALKKYIDNPEKFHPQVIWQVADIMHYKSDRDANLPLRKYLVEALKDYPERIRYLDAIMNYAASLNEGSNEELQLSVDLLKEAITIAKELNNDYKVRVIEINRAITLISLRQYKESKEVLERNLIHFREQKNNYVIQALTANLMNIYYYEGDFETCLSYGKESLKLSIELGNKWAECNIMNLLGNIYLNTSNFGNALETFTKALEAAHVIGDEYHIQMLNHSLSNVYHAMGRLDEAEETVNISKKICIKTNNIPGLLNCLCTEGNILIAKEQYEDSLIVYNSILKKLEEYPDKNLECVTLGNIASTYIQSGNLEKGEKLLSEFEVMSRDLSKFDSIALAYGYRVSLLLEQGKNSDALKLLDPAIEFSKKHSLFFIEKELREQKEDVLKLMKNENT